MQGADSALESAGRPTADQKVASKDRLADLLDLKSGPAHPKTANLTHRNNQWQTSWAGLDHRITESHDRVDSSSSFNLDGSISVRSWSNMETGGLSNMAIPSKKAEQVCIQLRFIPRSSHVSASFLAAFRCRTCFGVAGPCSAH